MVLLRLAQVRPCMTMEWLQVLTRCTHLAFFLHEDSFGKTGIGAANHSLGNIRCSAGYACQYGFRSYCHLGRRLSRLVPVDLAGLCAGTDHHPIVGHPCRTVEQIIPVYAPSSDGNNVTGYIDAVLSAVRAWRAGSIYV